MNTLSPVIQNLSGQLLAFELARDPNNGPLCAAIRACEHLRVSLIKLAGLAGFGSLLSRSLALARVQIPSLVAIQIRPDGSLDGHQSLQQQLDLDMNQQAGLEILTQLLGLLVTFIGEPLTFSLVKDVWPNASVSGMDAGNGEGI